MWEIYFTPQAQKDSRKISRSNLKDRVLELLSIIQSDPFVYPPEFEILKGKLNGFISRRINYKHRLVYEVDKSHQIIKIVKMWTHYE